MSCQQKSVTNYLCLSLKGEFLNTLGGCIERMHRGQLWERERERERERESGGGGGWLGSGVQLSFVSELVFFFGLELFRGIAGNV